MAAEVHTMRLKLDIFSGRKNPEYEIGKFLGRVILEYIKDINLDPYENPYLGYRGFWVDEFYVPAQLSYIPTEEESDRLLAAHDLALSIVTIYTKCIPESSIPVIMEKLSRDLQRFPY